MRRIAWLHLMRPPILHRDIKLANMLVRSPARACVYVYIVLGCLTHPLDRQSRS